jgi:phosphatidylglycerophosphate synthase
MTMSKRVSHSVLDPWIGPVLKSLYPKFHIPKWFPPEGIVLIGHGFAVVGGIGFALATQYWWAGLLAAFGIVGNHTADCIDGTHARASGQCRNGGELLDHFTDPISFTYWLIGIGFAVERLDLALVAVVCLLALANLTNIKAKLVGEFTLARFGPTEFKTLLFLFGVTLAIVFLLDPGRTGTVAFGGMIGLIVVGVFQVPYQLIRGIKEVNRDGSEPDTSEWVTK